MNISAIYTHATKAFVVKNILHYQYLLSLSNVNKLAYISQNCEIGGWEAIQNEDIFILTTSDQVQAILIEPKQKTYQKPNVEEYRSSIYVYEIE